MASTIQNEMYLNREWLSGDSTIILDGRSEWAPDENTEVIANWEILVEAEIRNTAKYGLLVIACIRELGGLHTEIDDRRITILLNDNKIDYFGLRVIPPAHPDYFHVQRRKPNWPWLWDVDPLIAGCQTIYSWPIQKSHLINSPNQIVKVSLEPDILWDIDYIALLICQEEEEDWLETDPQIPFARMWTNSSGPEGQPIGKDSFDQIIENNIDTENFEYNLLLVDRGEFKSGHGVGDAWLNGKPIVRHLVFSNQRKKNQLLTSLPYRILFHTLINDGNAGTTPELAKACWQDKVNADHLKLTWDEMQTAKSKGDKSRYRKLQTEFDRATRRVRTATSKLTPILKPLGIKIRTFGEGEYVLRPNRNYCALEILKNVED